MLRGGKIYRKSCCRILSSNSKKLLQKQREVRSHSDLSRRCRDRAAPGRERIHSSAVPCFQQEDAQHFPTLCSCSCSLIKTQALDLRSQTGMKSSPTHHPQILWETGLSMATPLVWLGEEVQQQLGRCWLNSLLRVKININIFCRFFETVPQHIVINSIYLMLIPASYLRPVGNKILCKVNQFHKNFYALQNYISRIFIL